MVLHVTLTHQSRWTNVLYPDGYTLTYGYDLLGRRTNVFDGAGISVTNAFNNQSLLIVSSNTASQVGAFVYDILNRLTNATDANGVKIGASYDSLNRLLTRSYPDGGAEDFGYSAFGLIVYTNQLTNATHYLYDALLRKTAKQLFFCKLIFRHHWLAG